MLTEHCGLYIVSLNGVFFCYSYETINRNCEFGTVMMPEIADTLNREDTPARVLISYSHDSEEHASRVLQLSDKLREQGIDCRIDQYEPVPMEGWPVWMERQITEADFVICICTNEYAKRFSFEADEGVGRGVAWESNLIRNALYRMPGANNKFLTAQFDEYAAEAIPACLQQYAQFTIATLEFDGGGYEKLYRHLTKQPKSPAIQIGSRVKLLENRGTTAPDRVPALEFVKLESKGQLLQSPKNLREELKSRSNLESSAVTPCEKAKSYLQLYQLAEIEAINANAPELGSIQGKALQYKQLVDKYCNRRPKYLVIVVAALLLTVSLGGLFYLNQGGADQEEEIKLQKIVDELKDLQTAAMNADTEETKEKTNSRLKSEISEYENRNPFRLVECVIVDATQRDGSVVLYLVPPERSYLSKSNGVLVVNLDPSSLPSKLSVTSLNPKPDKYQAVEMTVDIDFIDWSTSTISTKQITSFGSNVKLLEQISIP